MCGFIVRRTQQHRSKWMVKETLVTSKIKRARGARNSVRTPIRAMIQVRDAACHHEQLEKKLAIGKEERSRGWKMGKKRRGNTVNDFAKEYGRTMIVCRPQFILLLDIAGSLSSISNVSISCFRIIDDRLQTEEERKRNFGIVKRVRLQLKERERKADATNHGNSDARKTNVIRTLRWFTLVFSFLRLCHPRPLPSTTTTTATTITLSLS